VPDPEVGLTARSALAALAAAQWRSPRLELTEQNDFSAALITLSADPAARDALPADGQRSKQGDGEVMFLSCGPRRYLAVARADAVSSLSAHLALSFDSSAAVVDCSDQLCFITVGGADAATLLMRLCSIDLSPQAFPVHGSAVTRLQDVRAFLWRGEGARQFCLAIQRSLALHCWHVLLEAAKSLDSDTDAAGGRR
jgi:sarcosine oxidase subunit gamma